MKNMALFTCLLLALLVGSAGHFEIPDAPLAATDALASGKLLVKQNDEYQEAPHQRPAILDVAEPHFDHLTTNEGLSQSTVNAIVQDHQGYMWFGTNDGLNKYDGYTFTVYHSDPDDPNSLKDDWITTLYVDENGVLWAGTATNWLERYNRKTDNFTHHNTGNWPISINEVNEGPLTIYATGSISSKFAYIKNLDAFISLVDWTTNIFTDSSGKEWWLMDTKLYTGDPNYRNSWVEVAHISVGNFDTTFTEDSDGAIWIGSSGSGLYRYQPENGEITHFAHVEGDAYSLISDDINGLAEAEPGYLWIGTSAGLDYLNTNTGRARHIQKIPDDPHSLSDNTITNIYKDRSGILWIGTETGGINKMDTLGAHFRHFLGQSYNPPGITKSWVQGIAVDQHGDLWIGTQQGLSRYDTSLPGWRHYDLDPTAPSNEVNTIYEDRLGNLWVGSSGGLERFDRQADRFVHDRDGYSISMMEDPSGLLWVAWMGNRVYKVNPEKPQFISPNFTSPAFILKILADSRGNLWVGTWGGGLWYSAGSRWQMFGAIQDDPNSLGDSTANMLYEDSYGFVWVGTRGGLYRYNHDTEKFTRFSVKDGLPNDNIRGILEDKQGDLWVSSLGGISRLDPQTGAINNYDVNDGLQSNDFDLRSSFEDKDGVLYFGGTQGVTIFLPEEIQDNTHIPLVVVTKVSLFDQVILKNLRGDEEITLPYTQNTLSFEYAALDYASPEKNQYAYRMDGLDRDWVAAGTRRFAEYRNLPPGKYIFRVKGSNNDGLWNEEGAAVKITITPPFWQTAWFIGLVALAVVGAAYGVFRLRVRSIETRSRELEEQVTQRTQELSDANQALAQEVAERERAEEELSQKKAEAAVVAERNRLARDLHDSVTQSLYGVTLYSDAVDRQLDAGDLSGVKSNLSKLHATALEALGEMRLLVFELHPPTLEEAGLASAIQERLDLVERRSGKQVQFTVEGACDLPLLKQEGVYRIAQEALNNTLKHARAQTITVRLKSDEQTCLLEIQDDGAGFDLDDPQTHRGLGLRNMHERAEQLGGELTINSQPGKGTCVRVEVTTG